jgi:hypothetical protein
MTDEVTTQAPYDWAAEGALGAGEAVTYRRWAFLAGEGTLTADEVVAWARELAPDPIRLPAEIGGEDSLMVAVALPEVQSEEVPDADIPVQRDPEREA